MALKALLSVEDKINFTTFKSTQSAKTQPKVGKYNALNN